MPFPIPAFTDIRAALLRDILNQQPDADTSPDSDYFIRATSVASAVEGLYQHQAWTVRQLFPDTADTEYLERHAALRQIFRRPATAASGLIRFTGASSAPIPAALMLSHPDGRQYETQADGVIGEDGTAVIAVTASSAGTASRLAAGTALTLRTTPVSIDSTAVVVEMLGGTETETDAELLDRLLELIRRPPAGGNKYDFRRWAMEVAGVSAAYVYPLRRGVGTVDISVISAGGLPSHDLLTEVYRYIDDRRPVTGWDFQVLAPTPVYVDVAVAISWSGITRAEAVDRVETAVRQYFSELHPGDSVMRSHLETRISGQAGVTDRQLVSPPANITAVADASAVRWLMPGRIEVRDL
ncbi:baseplate J/gp47 family protein [Microvirgula aerodenitrificans]|uniref:baseplate J/gp47 family protein n=1 Tax=Microvirgula aerodenitrificans TaxID=57480 RepID=UPI000491AE50|nr:baseplate J/gp47 family protein [Microvirgula aerodenitrificans]